MNMHKSRSETVTGRGAQTRIVNDQNIVKGQIWLLFEILQKHVLKSLCCPSLARMRAWVVDGVGGLPGEPIFFTTHISTTNAR